MYKVIYKGINGGFRISEDSMDLETAREYKRKCIDMGYAVAYIIQIVE